MSSDLIRQWRCNFVAPADSIGLEVFSRRLKALSPPPLGFLKFVLFIGHHPPRLLLYTEVWFRQKVYGFNHGNHKQTWSPYLSLAKDVAGFP